MNITFEVLTQSGPKTVSCKIVNQNIRIDQIRCVRQKVEVEIDGQSVGTYSRIKLQGRNWLPWIDSEQSHKSQSLRAVAAFWAS